MTPEEDKIFGALTEYPLAPLEGVPTYEYMKNLNVYLNSCLSAVDCTPGCGTLGDLVFTAQHDVFDTNCSTALIPPTDQDIHPVVPDLAPTAAIFPDLSEPTSLQILTHLITEYAELKDNDIQEIDQKMKDPISSETIFE